MISLLKIFKDALKAANSFTNQSNILEVVTNNPKRTDRYCRSERFFEFEQWGLKYKIWHFIYSDNTTEILSMNEIIKRGG